jgi:hypothetical protein
VVSNAVRVPVYSRMVLVATVVPWTISSIASPERAYSDIGEGASDIHAQATRYTVAHLSGG